MAVDGEDVLTLGLEDLRSRLAIVPQESILFKGTIRSNLDPFGEYDDAALWAALDKAQLKGRVVRSLADAVAEGGSNYSQGERALLCMSRALLRTRGVLVMDEATANVDPENDARLQAMVRTQLKDCTVIAVRCGWGWGGCGFGCGWGWFAWMGWCGGLTNRLTDWLTG